MRLPVQEVVGRAQTPAGLKLRSEDAIHDFSRILGDLPYPALYLPEDEALLLLQRRVPFVLLIHLDVDVVAAVRVELHPWGRLVFHPEEPESHDDVGHLGAGVIDVVEDLEGVAKVSDYP